MTETTQNPWATLPLPARTWAPGARSVCQPIPLGQRADTTPVGLHLYRENGGRHPLIGGATGSGKSNTVNNLVAGIAACTDAVLWYIEVAKAGQGAAPWTAVIDWIATTLAEAVEQLRAAVAIIDARSRLLARRAATGQGADKIEPTIDLPMLIVILDEAAALFGLMTGNPEAIALAAEATELARRIAQTGRSAAVSLIVCTQRPTVASLGNDGDFRSQLFPNICLRMNRRADVGFVLQGADLDAVDTTLFNVPGLLYLQDGVETDPLPVRSYALYNPAVVYRIAQFYEPHRPTLDAMSRDAAGMAYARRPADPFADPGVRQSGTEEKPRLTAVGSPKAVQPSSTPTGRDYATAAEAQRAAVVSLEAARAAHASGERLAPVPAVAMSDLAAMHDTTPAPEEPGDSTATEAVLTALAEAGHEGLSATEIQRATGAHKATIYRVLRALTDGSQAHQTGVVRKYRYHLGPAPTTPGA